jgi:hypothetical protein
MRHWTGLDESGRGKAFELLSGLLQSGVICPVLDTPGDEFIGEIPSFFCHANSPSPNPNVTVFSSSLLNPRLRSCRPHYRHPRRWLLLILLLHALNERPRNAVDVIVQAHFGPSNAYLGALLLLGAPANKRTSKSFLPPKDGGEGGATE